MIANMRALIPWLILLALLAAPQDNRVTCTHFASVLHTGAVSSELAG